MEEHILETPRLILRPWKQEDAPDLYEQTKNPHIGPPAGWPPHKSVEDSRRVIQDVLSGDEAYAICLRTNGTPIGAIELIPNKKSTLTDRDDECELGYWIGESFWGQGLVPEAAKEMLRRAFVDLGMHAVWCGYYEGNNKSKRVQEKLGFKAFSVTPNVDVPLMGEQRTGQESACAASSLLLYPPANVCGQERGKSPVCLAILQFCGTRHSITWCQTAMRAHLHCAANWISHANVL